MKKRYFFPAVIALVSMFLFSCNSNEEASAVNLYKNREYLLSEFKDKSVINKGKRFYQMSYNKGESVNTFYFDKKNGVYTLTNDTLQYSINEIPVFATVNIADSSNYKKSVTNELERLVKIMDKFMINHVSAEDRTAGVDMKIYFGNYRALLYVHNIAAVKNERWKDYIHSGEKFDENWYAVKDN